MKEYVHHMHTLGTILQIPSMFNTTVTPTPLNILVNRSKAWSLLPYISSSSTTPIINTPYFTIQTYASLINTHHNIVITRMVHLSPPEPSPWNNGFANKQVIRYITTRKNSSFPAEFQQNSVILSLD